MTLQQESIPDRTLCRRCGKEFTTHASMFMPSCPHCGAGARPLLGRLQDNRNAAVAAVAAAALLTAGMVTPFMSMSQFGMQRTFSLLGGIEELYERGNFMLAGILFVFSVLFPFAKLAAILVATSRLARLSGKTRHRLHHLATITGRYSLLDLLVVAVMIVVIKFDGLLEAEARAGTLCFAAAVMLSIAAGFLINFNHLEPKDHE